MLLDTQEPKVSYKKIRFLKLIDAMWPHIVEKVAVFGLGNIAKKYQKQQFVSIFRQILRPKPDMLPNF